MVWFDNVRVFSSELHEKAISTNSQSLPELKDAISRKIDEIERIMHK